MFSVAVCRSACRVWLRGARQLSRSGPASAVTYVKRQSLAPQIKYVRMVKFEFINYSTYKIILFFPI